MLAFRRSKSPILQRSAGFTAHHIVALLFMIVATAVGFAGWFSPAAATSTAAARVLVADGTARWLSAICCLPAEILGSVHEATQYTQDSRSIVLRSWNPDGHRNRLNGK